MQAVEVVAKFDLEGVWTPISFIWRGGQYRVDSVGRRWEDTRGQHALVMTPGDRVFELIFVPEELVWYIEAPGPRVI